MSRDEILEAYLRGEITRRVFVRRLVAGGMSLAAAIAYSEIGPGVGRAWAAAPAALYGASGRVSYSGQITTSQGDVATFSGHAHGGRSLKGAHKFSDPGPATVLSFQTAVVRFIGVSKGPGGGEAVISDGAEGQGSYRIELDDASNGRPATYALRLFDSSGRVTYDTFERPLTSGHVKIH